MGRATRTVAGIPIKKSRVRKPPAPRTCCPTHTDNCLFGRWHLWAGPFLLDGGRPVDGEIWSHPQDVRCHMCGGVCSGDRDAPALAST